MITIEQENLIHELFKQGVPKTRIAKQVGCSTATVARHLKNIQIIIYNKNTTKITQK